MAVRRDPIGKSARGEFLPIGIVGIIVGNGNFDMLLELGRRFLPLCAEVPADAAGNSVRDAAGVAPKGRGSCWFGVPVRLRVAAWNFPAIGPIGRWRLRFARSRRRSMRTPRSTLNIVLSVLALVLRCLRLTDRTTLINIRLVAEGAHVPDAIGKGPRRRHWP